MFEGVNDGALANVRVANKSNTDLFFVGVKSGELTQKIYQCTCNIKSVIQLGNISWFKTDKIVVQRQ